MASSEKKLVPSAATNFPGSFGTSFRDDHRKQAPKKGWRSIVLTYLTDGWEDVTVWKSAFIEFVGTTAMIYLSAMIHTTIGSFDTLQVAPYVGITNTFLISLFILAMAPATGGHINPLITFSTVVTGLTGFSRGILYMIGQTAGGALAGGLVRGSYGQNLTQLYQGGGCLFEPETIGQGQAYLIESVMTFILLFVCFGVGLDPRQGKVMGPQLAPFLVGLTLGLTTFATVGIGIGYQGAGMNPARCFAFAVARGNFKYQWIWWVGPLTGSLFHAFVYHVAPPYHREQTLARAANHHVPNYA